MPSWRAEIEKRLPADTLATARGGDVLHELAVHLDERYEELRVNGLSEEEAYRAVVDELNGSDALQRELAAMPRRVASPAPGEEGRAPLLADLGQDIRFALRMLGKTPGFTAVAVITLALGIGANTAIFTVINAVLLRPLPFADSDRLVRIWESNPEKGWPQFAVSHPSYLDWAAHANAFDRMAASTFASFTLTDGDQAERVVAMSVTHGFLPVLGVSPTLGRNFVSDEDRPGGNVRVALLTHSYWQHRFGGDAGILSRTLTLNGQRYVVVGVLPETFAWGTANLEVLVPLAPDPARNRGDHRLTVIGRMKEGVSLEQARADLETVARSLAQQYPVSNAGWTTRMLSFYEWIVPEETRRSLGIFAAAVIAVLLIACSNVASLLLARATTRHKEIAVRLALGARRRRVVRQLLVEALLLSIIAGAAGLLVAFGTSEWLRAMPPDNLPLPRLDEVSLDWRVIGFAFGASVVTGIVFGLVPALAAMKFDVNDTLKDGGRAVSGGPRRQRARSALVVGELALSVALLVGAGMLLRSFWELLKVDPGFKAERLLTLQINLPGNRYNSREKAWGFYERLLHDLGALPGVESVAMASMVPLDGGNTATEVQVPGRPRTAATDRLTGAS